MRQPGMARRRLCQKIGDYRDHLRISKHADVDRFHHRSETNSCKVSAIKPGATPTTRRTPCVDWTVRAVMQETPKHSCAAIVLMSAVIPAPEEGSNPAIVKTTGGVTAMPSL